jgi:ribosomal protein S18 acetylase RimI-like enzyme
MTQFIIREFIASDTETIVALQQKYSRIYPAAPVIPGEVYLSPGFHGGKSVFCAFSHDGELLGYAPLYACLAQGNTALPHIVWAEIKTDSEMMMDDTVPLKECLFQRLLRRTKEIVHEAPGHETHLTFQYYPSEIPSIRFVLSKGCKYTESIYRMCRELKGNPLPDVPVNPLPDGITIRSWRMESVPEQQAFVLAHNEALPGAAITLEDWQHFLHSPQWSVGTTLTAFEGDRIAGSVTVYWAEADNASPGAKVGFTENVFVRSDLRGQGIARHILRQGLRYLHEHGLDSAYLEVRAQNQAALRVYERLGYRVVEESRLYVFVM